MKELVTACPDGFDLDRKDHSVEVEDCEYDILPKYFDMEGEQESRHSQEGEEIELITLGITGAVQEVKLGIDVGTEERESMVSLLREYKYIFLVIC